MSSYSDAAGTPPITPAPSQDGPSSRRHRPKTRTGCKTCKQRKIKCDEHKPSCWNCIKHDVPCPFLPAGGHHRPAPQLDGPYDQNSQLGLNLLDLELIHNFCTFTYMTMADDSGGRHFWRFTAVRLGVSCAYLMSSILAVSALHMAHHQPDRRDRLVEYALDRHRAATQAAMGLLSDVKPEHRENLWTFSVLTIFFALGLPKSDDRSLLIGEFARPDRSLPDWLFLIRGVEPLHKDLSSPQYKGPASLILMHGRDRHITSHTPEHTASPLLRELQQRVNASPQAAESGLLPIYNATIEELRTQLSFCLSSSRESLDVIDAFVWQNGLAFNFLPLLRDPTQEAAAIFAHFCVLLHGFEGCWWLQGWSVSLLAKVWDILDAAHRPWVQWAVEQIGWVPPL